MRADGSAATERKTLKANVPAGVVEGQKIRLRGQGQPGIGGGNNGDLFLEVGLEDDRRFESLVALVSVQYPPVPGHAPSTVAGRLW